MRELRRASYPLMDISAVPASARTSSSGSDDHALSSALRASPPPSFPSAQAGLTNMLDRSMVSQIALMLGHEDTHLWIEAHSKEYAEGVFRGFTSKGRAGS